MAGARWRTTKASVLVLLGACSTTAQEGSPTIEGEVTLLYGEVHLHQYPEGSHATALFVAEPLPRAGSNGDELVNLDPPVVARAGGCALHVQPTCAPSCGARTLCLRTNECVAISPLVDVDAGPVTVTGSAAAPKLKLTFAGADATYRSDPSPGPPLFAGGESLRLEGGAGDLAFVASLLAPIAVAVTSPDLTKELHFPLDASMVVQWTRAQSLPMTITLTASTVGGGDVGFIVCAAPDTGALTVPAELMRGLPRPPRDLYFSVERRDLQIVPTRRPSVGVIVHAGTITAKDGRDG